ncbi:ABC transporter permease [Bacillus horti]|uniref:ABC-2 type transport system permease protein n=1 Tax=Caldalkalibacillus horti TaxID=77523 RepID=A0ABT9W0I3_9BACI|nr:ABC transporter permease [Bacillus horti]MDQ0166762.1 ABC-2 type transport system permease protein [Bacillus horti]
MRNSWKVATWELQKNLKNKSFIISIFLTPAIFLLFALIPNLLSSNGPDFEDSIQGIPGNTPHTVTIYTIDELELTQEINEALIQAGSGVRLEASTSSEEQLSEQVTDQENLGYVRLDQRLFEEKQLSLYVGHEDATYVWELNRVINDVLDAHVLRESGAGENAIQYAIQPLTSEAIPLTTDVESDFLKHLIPGVVAGVILFSIMMTGMMQFQSALQEKKDKVSEIILSSITAHQLMQGKIIGYFLLGIIQIGVWLAIGIPAASLYFDISIVSYLLNVEFLMLLSYSIAGYLLFSCIFVALGATMDDLNTSSNFQGVIFMLPFIPFILIAPVVTDPNGIVAVVSSYIPITAPAIMILRLSLTEPVATVEVILSLIVLAASIWVMMKVAGKIFKTGIMMYGKNATLGEIWKWIRQ